MEMIIVILVIVGAKDSIKNSAGTPMNFLQKETFRAPTSPAFLDIDGMAARESELRNIDSIGISVFRKAGAVPVVLWAAGIGRNDIHVPNRLIEVPIGRRLNNFPYPFLHGRHHGTTQGRSG